MQYEVTLGGGEIVIACRPCTDLVLSRDHAASASPEPAAPDCELGYEGLCHDSTEARENRLHEMRRRHA